MHPAMDSFYNRAFLSPAEALCLNTRDRGPHVSDWLQAEKDRTSVINRGLSGEREV